MIQLNFKYCGGTQPVRRLGQLHHPAAFAAAAEAITGDSQNGAPIRDRRQMQYRYLRI